jgi:23S rRNA pseudouridine2605 synthase
MVRLQRVLADAGVAARRVCERMIEEGRVTVNGHQVRRLPVFVNPKSDRISVDGRPVPLRGGVGGVKPGAGRRDGSDPSRHVYVMLNKPSRTLTSTADEPGADRRTVTALVKHPAAARLFPVGRLDYDTVGLLLLTNDGELANRLTHPRYGVPRTYRAKVKGSLTPAALARLGESIRRSQRELLKGPARRAADAEGGGSGIGLALAGHEADKTLVDITVRHGKLDVVRRAFGAMNCPITRLERTAIGPLKLSGLARGSWRELERHELKLLRRAGIEAEQQPASAPGGPVVGSVQGAANRTIVPTRRPMPRSTAPRRTGSGDERPSARRGAPRARGSPGGREGRR